MKSYLTFSAAVLLTGCASAPNTVAVEGVQSQADDARSQRIQRAAPVAANTVTPASPQLILQELPLLTVNDYARNLVHELMSLQQALDENSFIGVTDFSFVDSALDKGSVLSHHLSEALIYDFHKFGVPVLDYKVTDYIRVTPSGDFVLSRNYQELSAEVPIRYVVTGTLTSHQQGILVNARLIQIDNKQVVSAARSFIPRHIVQALISSQGEQQLRIKQG
ncbi:FlgO family outer membrane protein [Arsukibacterium sp.]|uniref:FlgO family outer membrane protein n=1 Tax=Arsukibacterium sp. TaxID=1977258 RepID=UPI002FD91421